MSKSKQQFLESDCDDGKKIYYTTDNKSPVKFEQQADDGGPSIFLRSPGVYEIIIGFFITKEQNS